MQASERVRAALAVLAVLAAASAASTRHGFYRDMAGAAGAAGAGGARRLFGGRAASPDEWGAVCALLDRYWAARCSGAVVAPRWALTAAHCVSDRLAYVAYNTRHPRQGAADVAPVHYLYRHPQYRVQQEDDGRGMDVTVLQHDVGLVRTRAVMSLRAPPPVPLLEAMTLYNAVHLADEPVDVLGFGRTEWAEQGEELFATRLVLGACGRSAWVHCVCGTAGEGRDARGVCSGDSGGPVVYRGAQVALTSMGPMQCAPDSVPGVRLVRGERLTSVFTTLREYATLLNATVCESDEALRMTRVSSADHAAAPRRLLVLPLAWWYAPSA